MHITTASACGILTFEDFKIDLDRRVMLVVGPNGTGKSNFDRLFEVVRNAIQGADRDSPDFRQMMDRYLAGRRVDLDEHGIEVRLGYVLTEPFEEETLVTFVRACVVHSLVGLSQGFDIGPIEKWAEDGINSESLRNMFTGELVLQHRGTPDGVWQCGVEFDVGETRCRWMLLGEYPDSIIRVEDLGRSPVQGLQLNDRLRGATASQSPSTTVPETPFTLSMLQPPVGSSITCALDLGLRPPPRAFRQFAEQIGIDPLGASAHSAHYNLARVFSLIFRRSSVMTSDTRLLPSQSYSWSTPNASLEPGAEGRLPEMLLQLKNGRSADVRRYRSVQRLFQDFTHGRVMDVGMAPVTTTALDSNTGGLAVAPVVFVSVNPLPPGDSDQPFPQVFIDFAGAGAWEALVLAAVLGSQESSLVILDEPAVALHPNLQRRLMSYIQGSRAQFIVITHSPYLFPLDFDLRETRIVRFDRTQRSVTQPWCVADSVLEKMAPKLRQTGNERIAFASRVVLCEGKGDQAAIRTLAEETRLDLDSYNIGVIDCDGRDNIPDYARFCSALGLHYLAVQDGDASKPDAKPKVEAVRNAVAATDFGLLFEFYENIETSLGCAKKDTDVLSRAMRQAASDDSVPAEIAELRSKLSDLVRGVALTA